MRLSKDEVIKPEDFGTRFLQGDFEYLPAKFGRFQELDKLRRLQGTRRIL